MSQGKFSECKNHIAFIDRFPVRVRVRHNHNDMMQWMQVDSDNTIIGI